MGAEREEILSVKQVAKWLHVSERFVRDHAEEFHPIHIGGTVDKSGPLRFRQSSVEKWIEQGGSRPAPSRRPNETASGEEPKRMAG